MCDIGIQTLLESEFEPLIKSSTTSPPLVFLNDEENSIQYRNSSTDSIVVYTSNENNEEVCEPIKPTKQVILFIIFVIY